MTFATREIYFHILDGRLDVGVHPSPGKERFRTSRPNARATVRTFFGCQDVVRRMKLQEKR